MKFILHLHSFSKLWNKLDEIGLLIRFAFVIIAMQ